MGRVVERAEELGDKPGLIGNRVVAPRPAEHDKLDLVAEVPHLLERPQARGNLQVRVEEVALGALAGRLGMQIALGHAQVVRAVQTVARALPGLGDDRDRGDARRRAPRLHAKRAHEARLELVIDAPRCPARRVLFLDAQVVRQDLLLGIRALGRFDQRVMRVDELAQLAAVEAFSRPEACEYFE